MIWGNMFVGTDTITRPTPTKIIGAKDGSCIARLSQKITLCNWAGLQCPFATITLPNKFGKLQIGQQ